MEIKIKSFKKQKNNMYQLLLEDGNKVSLYDEVILKNDLLLKKSIDSKTLTELLRSNNEALCYNTAVKYLGIKLRHKKEMIAYLKRKGFDDNIIADCIERLEKQNYLNEEVYVKAFVNDCLNLTNYGPIKIKQKLETIGADSDLISKYLDAVSPDIWLERLNNLIDKKINLYKSLSQNKTKEKIYQNCFNEGYYKEDIGNILGTKEITSDLKGLEKEYNRLRKKLENKYQNEELAYQVKGRLLKKGYSIADIEEFLANKKGD